MYTPRHFDDPRLEAMHALIRARPLATLITRSGESVDANHIPLHLDPARGPMGTLVGHVARANPVWREHRNGAEVLVVFHGPDAYVSPSWYPTKKIDGRALPTWDFAVVHARGPMSVIHDPGWILAQIAALTARNEARFETPWTLADAPADYVAQRVRGTVGIEIPITGIRAKKKLNQNHPEENRQGVIDGLRRSGEHRAHEVADLVEQALRDDGS